MDRGAKVVGWILLGVGVGALQGCGGGGGQPVAAQPPIAAPPPSGHTSFAYSPEYEANYGVAMIKADAAYNQALSGVGVKVAVIDTGIDLDHVEFVGRIDPASRDIVSTRPGGATVQDPEGHGTAVAGVIAANLNAYGTHGVAYDSRILAIRSDAPGSCPTACELSFSDLARAIDYAVAQNADIINLSVGSVTRGSAELEAALGRAASAGVLVVAAAGNNGAASPTYPGAYAAEAFMAGSEIVVGAVRADGVMASFSNHAGATKDFYLAAPGSFLESTVLDGGTGKFSGTSFAAPHVSGAAALVLDHAPHLTSAQLAQILLTTADATGTPEQYGRGLLNVERALAPIGQLAVPHGDSVAGTGSALEDARLTLASVVGDADGSWNLSSLVLDAYGRPYAADLGGGVRRGGSSAANLTARAVEREAGIRALAADETMRLATPSGTAGATRLDLRAGADATLSLGQADTIDGRLGIAADIDGAGNFASAGAFGTPYLGFASDERTALYATRLADGSGLRLGIAQGADGHALAADWTRSWSGGIRLNLHGGSVTESAGWLGGNGAGALATGRTTTGFAGLQVAVPLGEDLTLIGHATAGRSEIEGGEGVLRGGAMLSTGFGLGALAEGVWAEGDRLGLALSRPLRADAGTATLSLPVARTLDGQVVREMRTVDLVPTGQQFDIELAYRLPVGVVGSFAVNALLSLEPGHAADADPAAALGLRYRSAF